MNVYNQAGGNSRSPLLLGIAASMGLVALATIVSGLI